MKSEKVISLQLLRKMKINNIFIRSAQGATKVISYIFIEMKHELISNLRRLVLDFIFMQLILTKNNIIIISYSYGKNDFKVFKNLIKYIDRKIILLDYQNCYVCRTFKLIARIPKHFAALLIMLEFPI